MQELLISLLFLSMTSAAQDASPAKETESCPMHQQHAQIASMQHSSGVDERGDKAMGFDHTKTTHHFLLNRSGGAIEVSANSADDRASVTQIQMHLQHIAKAFAAGDFAIPMFVHDQVPPGVPAMKRLAAEIKYAYEPMQRGARVVISSENREAVTAIRDFLRFQIRDHNTGDPQ